MVVTGVAVKRPAGAALLEWAQTPMGEEILEGTVGGLMAGVPLFFVQDQDKGQAALMTAGAVLGGIGVGMAGRRIGRAIGKQVHPEALADQEDFLATAARTLGNESTAEGLQQQGRMMRGQVADYLVNRQAAKMVANGEVSEELINELKGVRGLHSVMDSYGSMTPEQRSAVRTEMMNQMGLTPEKLAQLSEIEEKLTKGAADSMDDDLRDFARKMQEYEEAPPGASAFATGLLNAPEAVTGEHVGAMLGRIGGDEIGILGGMGLAGLLSAQMGMQSPKDMEIARLKEQLGMA